MKTILSIVTALIICSGSVLCQNPASRSHVNFDEGWKFSFGHADNPEQDYNYSIPSLFKKSGEAVGTAVDPKFNDSLWRTLDLPHDWAVELPFVNDPASNVMAHGYKPLGGNYPETSIGWYRKHFTVPVKEDGRRYEIQFDGVFRDANFWVNGFYLGNNESGYLGANYDITDFLNYEGNNVIVVRVDASQYEGWFYEGAGMYRHVWLNTFDDLHLVHDGIFVHSNITEGKAEVHVSMEVENLDISERGYRVEAVLTTRDGQELITKRSDLFNTNPHSVETHDMVLEIDDPILWDLENPYLYRVHFNILEQDNSIVDQQVIKHGFRTIEVKVDGVYLNGKHIKIQGVNCHQDHAGVGSALPDYLQYYRIRLLKNMGVNSYRASHNPPTPELLDACDSLGMLVMDEPRLLNSGKEYIEQFERVVRRDRSRTCVLMWCIGNEEFWIQRTSTGRAIAETFISKLESLDPTRTCTYASDLPNVFEGINEVIPVRGFNYREFAVEDYHNDHPDQPIIGTEMGSTVTTRGEFRKDSIRGYLPDHDLNAPWWASTAEKWWTLAAENDFWLGGYIWTGFDYRGEPTPFQWPNINSHFGIMDMAGFPKNLYYYYQSWWTDKDVLHIAPHWNWHDKRGEEIEVWVNTNADDVELFLNDRSMGKKVMPRNGHLRWKVKYEPGILKAVANKKGKLLTKIIETTGPPFEIVITPYKTTVVADGQDATVINISVVDREGREVPNADNMIRFHIEGDGRIIGVGNGDPSSHEPDVCIDGAWQRSLFNGKCQVILKAGKSADKIKFQATAPNLWSGSTDIHSILPEEVASVHIDEKYMLKGEAAEPRKVGPMIGADISFLPQLEDRGMIFKIDGQDVDAIEALRDHGFNYVRLRLFKDPAREGGYSPGKGFCDLEHTLEMAKRVKAAGMKLLLDFHYSDYWADPGKQYMPKAWEGLAFDELKSEFYNYTHSVIKALKDQGTSPDMVQIGNEINHGIMWPAGHVSKLDQLGQLINAGTKAVKDVDPSVIMMLHVALGGQNDESVFFIDNMIRRGVHFDVIGESYYPKWHGTLDDLRDNLNDLVRRYDKDIILVEYSARKDEVHKIVHDLPGSRGKGTCIWEPLNTWEKLFDDDGNANEYMKLYTRYADMFLK